MAAHLYWRWVCTRAGGFVDDSRYSAGTFPSIVEIVFYDSSGTPISTSGATTSASSQAFGSTPPSAAIDGSNTTFWESNNIPSSASPEWWQIQFPSAVDVDHFVITSNGGLPNTPMTEFYVQYSDTGSSWTTAYTYRNAVYHGNSIYSNTFYTYGTTYRLNVTSNASGSSISVANIKFFDGSGTQISTATGTALASNWDGGGSGPDDPPSAFSSGSCSSWFTSQQAPSVSFPQWISWQFPASVTVASFSFQSPNSTALIANTPVNFELDVSTDGLNFTTALGPFTAAAWTTTCQTQTFGTTTSTSTVQPYLWFVF